MNLALIKYVLEVESAGSISKAARNLFITQPSLSTQISELEKSLGAKIFKRSNRGITLTEFGIKFLDICKHIDMLMDYAQLEAINYKRLGKSILSVFSVYSYSLLDVFKSFYEISSTIDSNIITYEELHNFNIVPRISANEESGIGILYYSTSHQSFFQEEFKSHGLKSKLLYSEKPHIVVGKEHPLFSKKSASLEDLAMYPVLFEKITSQYSKEEYYENNPFPKLFLHNKRCPITFYNNRSLLHYISSSNETFTVGQKCLNISNPYLINGKIKYIPIDNIKDEEISVVCIYSSELSNNGLKSEFISSVEKFFSDLP